MANFQQSFTGLQRRKLSQEILRVSCQILGRPFAVLMGADRVMEAGFSFLKFLC